MGRAARSIGALALLFLFYTSIYTEASARCSNLGALAVRNITAMSQNNFGIGGLFAHHHCRSCFAWNERGMYE
ncbi:hypothetical protein HPP92_027334 [Vanilla planifolia]|uniref:Uncharacterized protein n=1 Tax=Vanilla planifolia TaxID=51239 RepID=A0A835PFL9_VANPL|nr:hypothetical protein HPP92_027334 [Vanilla planifolia]